MQKLFGLDMSTIAGCLGAALFLVLLVLVFLGWRNNVMLKLGVRPILRRRTQSGLIVVGLMLATLIITAAFVTGDTLSYTIRSLVVEELGSIDEIIHVRTQSGGAAQSGYFYMSVYDDLATELAGYDLIDSMVPVIQEYTPAVNLTRRQSVRSMEIGGVRPQDEASALPVAELTDASGRVWSLSELGPRQILLNKVAAERLEAQVGDKIELHLKSSTRQFTVAAISGSGRSPKAYMTLGQAQLLFGEQGRANLILISNLGDDNGGAAYSEAVTTKLRDLLTDPYQVQRLFGLLSVDSSAGQALRKAAPSYQGNARSDLLTLAAALDSGKLDAKAESLLADEGVGGEVQSVLDQAGWQSASARARLEKQFESLSEYSVQDVKRDGLDSAELAASAFTTIFVATGLFGIASGLLLIFLIFVMLAAERKSEMGMTRAIGAQRRHLVQMFVYEGTAYDLVAAGVGVALGVLTGMAVALTLGQAFASSDLAIRPNVSLKSLAVSYSLGMLVTFLTVLFSAYRVSRLNIVAAIRDLPEPEPRPVSLLDRFLSPVRTFWEGFRQLRRWRVWRALRTWLIGVPGSLARLVLAGFRGGILTLLLGMLLVPVGLSAHSGALFTLGMSFALIGGGLVLRAVIGFAFKRHKPLAERLAFTAVGLSLTVFWSLPSSAFERFGVVDLKSGPEMLFIAGFMMVVGAVMVVMYNTDLLLKIILRVLGGGGRLAPVLRMAVAYPLANRFRTGLTLGMFGVVVFSVVFMATAFKANETFFANTEALTGGFQLRAQASANNPIPNLAQSVAVKPKLREAGIEVVTSEATLPVELKQEGGRWSWYQLRAVDKPYMEHAGFGFAVKAEGYTTDEDVWRALATHPGYAVIDSYPVPSRTTTSIVIGGPDFKLNGVYLEDETMAPIRLRVRDAQGETFEVTVIGVLKQTGYLTFGLLTSQATLEKALPSPPTPTLYYMTLAPGADPGQAGSALESAFMEYGLETVDQVHEIENAQASQRAVEQLLLGFLTLGLIVGVAALGVISSRAVVERRQQIGVLRALGFQPQMVTWSFMVEASFVALLGIGLGAGLALIPAYQLIMDTASDVPGLTFSVPWGSIALVVGLAYGMALLASYLPALQASKVAPAEALRYE